MDRDAVFEAWSPREGVWSPWVKPVLFAHVDADGMKHPFSLPSSTWVEGVLRNHAVVTADRASQGQNGVAVVVDLPGVAGVAVGLALAELGYRPVPLYTALPAPDATVPMHDVVRALVTGAGALERRSLPPSAPPAFLLDSRRDGRGARPGLFDNRSIAFPTDFPSSGKLRDSGIGAVLLIQADSHRVRPDLAETLAAWQKGGLPISLVRSDAPATPTRIVVQTQTVLDRFVLWLRRATVDRDDDGAFGHRAPHGG